MFHMHVKQEKNNHEMTRIFSFTSELRNEGEEFFAFLKWDCSQLNFEIKILKF